MTRTLAIPTGTTFGAKRVRLKYNFSNATINSTLTTACSDMTNGQIKDYSINYKDSTLAVGNATNTTLSLYPNPFKDILKISDVKGVKSISVSDTSGRMVKTLAPNAELNLSELKAGLYIVNLQMQDGTIKTVKAIKK